MAAKRSLLASKGSLLAAKHPFFASKRSRLITIAAAGTLSVASVATAVAAVLPSAPAAASASAFDHVMTTQRQSGKMTAAQQLTAFDRMRFGLGERQQEYNDSVAKAAAAKAAAAKDAAAKAAAHRHSAGTPSGSPQQIAQGMLGQFGWSSSEMSCLSPLWYHESGWSTSAENPGSGAYGIPQSLPGSQMASAGPDWQTNPATQIKWGLTYIHDRYGSPCGAWSHEQSSNWY